MTNLNNVENLNPSKARNGRRFSIRLLAADKESKPPLPGFRAKVERLDKDGKVDAILFAGRAGRRGDVNFALDLPKEAADQPAAALATVRLTVFDLDGDVLHTEDIQPEQNKDLSPGQITTAPHDEKLRAPLERWADAVGETISVPLKKLLRDNNIDSLADLRVAKDLSRSREISAADRRLLRLMKAHAKLQILSRDHKINRALIAAGFRSMLDIAREPRKRFLAKVSNVITDQNAWMLYSTTRIQLTILNGIYTDLRAKWANNIHTSGNLKAIEPPCKCDCGSAVSPQAYLVDLLDYAADNVLENGNTIDLPALEIAFGQPFADLLVDCDFADKLVRQVRLCAEVLHRRGVLKDDDKITKAVNTAVIAHVKRSYETLLRAIGTSYRELRLVRSDDEASKLLAERLGITNADEGPDRFRLERNANNENHELNEDRLEQLFGLQGTARDPLSTGARFNDPRNQITRWELRGVQWRKNTDSLGRIYVGLTKLGDKHHVTLYRDAAKQQPVAHGTNGSASGEIKLKPVNHSGLAATVRFDFKEGDDTQIYLAVVPEWTIRRRDQLRELWLKADHPTSEFSGPIIDPDIVFESDLRRPFEEEAPLPGNPVYKLWQDRKKVLQDERDLLGSFRSVGVMIRELLEISLIRWNAIADGLRSADVDETNQAKQSLHNEVSADLAPEAFLFLLELLRREIANREINPQEREQALDVLVNLFKRKKFGDWKTEETNQNIQLSAPFFLPTIQDPILNPLRASAEERASWLAELERNSAFPLVDPDIISRANFAPDAASNAAFEKWTSRAAELESLGKLKIDSVTALERALTKSDLPDGVPEHPFAHLGFTAGELTTISAAFEQETVLPITPEQYGLTRAELRKLFEVRKLNEPDAKDWQEVVHILVQSQKRRFLYPRWRREERDLNIFLSPDVFHAPSDALDELSRWAQRPAAFLLWRFDLTRQRDWRAQLQRRIEQDQAVEVELQTAIDAAEESSLPTLRDDLVKATVSRNEAGGTSLEERNRWVMNHLLINAFENGCRKTTRVAQAMETMQLLLWGIHSKQFENLKYELEPESAATFAEEWRTLGSYGTWRGAMFTFLYPENLLLPELRRGIGNADTDPTKLFRAILKVMSGEALPPQPASDTTAPAPLPDADDLSPIVEVIFSALDHLMPGETNFQTLEAQEIIFEQFAIWRFVVGDAQAFLEDGHFVDADHGPLDIGSNPYYFVPQFEQTSPIWWTYLYPSAFLEDVLYLPLTLALNHVKLGHFAEALYWFSKIYDFRTPPREGSQGWVNPRLELYFDQRETTDSNVYEGFDDWLDDNLNPHRIAATRTGADLRFVILSIARCLLDYADSEFAKDTSETIARARELYETARRLLDSEHLGKKSDCDDIIGTLLTEIGEDKWAETVVTVFEEPERIDEEDLLPREVYEELMGAVRIVGRPTEPPTPQLRQNVINVVLDHLAPETPERLDQRRLAGNIETLNAYEKLLADKKLFTRVQQAGPNPFSFAQSISAVPAVNPAPLDKGGVIRAPRFEFCIPRNPLIAMLRLRYEASWFKLNNCMNLAGQYREVPPYAASTDTYSGMPVADIGGAAAVAAIARALPTQYRYRVLIERARQLVAMAQQMESSYLSFIEKHDQEAYNILKARQELGIADANVRLQDLRVTEADHGRDLAQLQVERAQAAFDHYDELIRGDLSDSEKAALGFLIAAAVIQNGVAIVGGITSGVALAGGGAIAAGAGTLGVGAPAGGAAGGVLGAAGGMLAGALATGGAGLATTSSAFSMVASFERRKEEWQFQKQMAEFDQGIAAAQKTLAQDRYDITRQEKQIAEMSARNASDVVTFLDTKFTSVELYSWMSGIVGGIYRYFLQEATTIAKLAQRQLAFERQAPELPIVLDDYWTYTDTSAIPTSGNGSTDRRGMTGSVRLLQDITRLDQQAFLTDRRKLQLSKTVSLALYDPIAFARFRESGVLKFSTTLEQFDRDFPGHYLRLIKRVRVSVIALIPPTEGIRATLSSSGTSRVVCGGSTFTQTEIQRPPENISFTAPINATGQFELQEQTEMLLPFEGTGVAAVGWSFSMPRAANHLDFNTIADVLLTIDYTALDSEVYRTEVIRELDWSSSGERPFSFRRDFADQWYDLNHPELVEDGRQMVVSFETLRSDFPPNLSELRIAHVSLYFIRKAGFTDSINVESLMFTPAGKAGVVGGRASTTTGLISTRERANSGSWLGMQGKSPVGKWELNLLTPGAVPAVTDKIKGWFTNGDLEDILFVITFTGTTPEWPSA